MDRLAHSFALINKLICIKWPRGRTDDEVMSLMTTPVGAVQIITPKVGGNGNELRVEEPRGGIREVRGHAMRCDVRCDGAPTGQVNLQYSYSRTVVGTVRSKHWYW